MIRWIVVALMLSLASPVQAGPPMTCKSAKVIKEIIKTRVELKKLDIGNVSFEEEVVNAWEVREGLRRLWDALTYWEADNCKES